ncbi:putative polyol transporter 1 [Magnolia sinica]|uniref:putative polyol transporter 1 n=1 Tax=Magnolia sinica TaxID=86752 RepID=UPI00265A754F|nr:putative polyol transporter 1 [Magnolia sinica]
MGDQMTEKIATASVGPPLAVSKPRRNKYALACTMLASMASILLGYDVGVLSGAMLFIKEDLKLNDTKVEVLMGILNLYSLIGSTAAGRTSDWIGRRYTIVCAAVIFFFGALMMGLAPNYAFLMAGRFVAGIGVGYALMIAPVYTAEVAPASCRGFLTSFPEVFINFGILLGYISNYAFAGLPNHINWRLMLGVGAIPSVFLGFAILVMPESPRWLIMQGQLGEAKRVLGKTSDSKEEAEIRLAEIKEAAGIPEDCNDDVVPVPKRSRGEGVWKDLLIRPSPSVRRILVAAIGIHFFQQASGIDVAVLYSPRIFEKAGIKSKNGLLGATVAVGFTKTVCILLATFFLDKVGRRPLLLSSSFCMVVSLLALGSGLTVIDHNPHKKLVWAIVLCITTVLTFVGSFSIGLGPITWVYSPEIIPLRLRAQGMSLAVATNRVTSGVIGMTYLSLSNAITIGGTFYLFAGIATLSLFFFYTFLPETRGKTLEEMETLFVKPKEKTEGNAAASNGRDQLGRTIALASGQGTTSGHDSKTDQQATICSASNRQLQ